MRQSSQVVMKSCPVEPPQQMVQHFILSWVYFYHENTFQDLTDTDYDFPASSEDVDTHEWEEYDEPQPVIPDTSVTSHTEEMGGASRADMDYDDPVHRYR